MQHLNEKEELDEGEKTDYQQRKAAAIKDCISIFAGTEPNDPTLHIDCNLESLNDYDEVLSRKDSCKSPEKMLDEMELYYRKCMAEFWDSQQKKIDEYIAVTSSLSRSITEIQKVKWHWNDDDDDDDEKQAFQETGRSDPKYSLLSSKSHEELLQYHRKMRQYEELLMSNSNMFNPGLDRGKKSVDIVVICMKEMPILQVWGWDMSILEPIKLKNRNNNHTTNIDESDDGGDDDSEDTINCGSRRHRMRTTHINPYPNAIEWNGEKMKSKYHTGQYPSKKRQQLRNFVISQPRQSTRNNYNNRNKVTFNNHNMYKTKRTKKL